jgi:hypothetical protein
MGIFEDAEIDVASAEDDPFATPLGSFFCTLTSCKFGKTKAGDKHGITFTFTCTEGEYSGYTFRDWMQVPDPVNEYADADMKASYRQKLSFLKQRLRGLGIPQEKMNEWDPEDSIGDEFVVTTSANKKGNVYLRVEVPSEFEGTFGSDGGVSNPFAD